MAFYVNLNYVTDGLWCMLDAANTSSYPGSGTTWTDLSGNGRNYTINASAYTNGYAGNSQVKYMNFEGSYGIATPSGGSAYPISDTDGITVCVWTRILDSTSNWRTLLRGATGSSNHPVMAQNGTYQLGMYDNVNGSGFQDSLFSVQGLPGYPTTGSVPTTNLATNQQWVMMVFTFSASSPYWTFRLNNNPAVLGSITNSNARFGANLYAIGGFQGDAGNSPAQFWGDIAVIQIYNKTLTQGQINQNYDAFVPRFNGGVTPAAGTTGTDINVFPGIVPLPTSTAVGATLYNDGISGYWSYPGAAQSTPASGFQYRSILTHGYLAAGYKGSNPWRAVNRTWHATDITMYCGEQLDLAGAYIDGSWSDYNGYVHATNDAFTGASSHTSSYSLANGTIRIRGSGTYSPPGSSSGGIPTQTGSSGLGGWDMGSARQNGLIGGVNQTGQIGYICAGGAAATDKFYFSSEIMFAGPAIAAAWTYSACAHGQNVGWFSFQGNRYYLTWSNDTWSSWTGSNSSPDGWCKILSTKLGYHYGSNGGNVTSGISKFSDSTGVDITTMTKIRACGEENFQMGQNWGYMLGNYDGQQNNQTVKYNYLTDTLMQLGTGAQPKGHFGQSSGACSSASATVCGSNASVGY